VGEGKPTVVNIISFGRLGLLVAGLGVGAAVATSPGIALADSSTDWLSPVDSLLGGGGLPALSSSTLDYQISIDGYDLFPTTGNLATATSGTGDIAIAYGDGAVASATGGIGDYASAIGENTTAIAQFGSGDSAIADGHGSIAYSGGENSTQLGNFDNASAVNGIAEAGDVAHHGTGSFDSASVFGPGTGGTDEALSGNGNYDSALALGSNAADVAVFGNGNISDVINTGNSLDFADSGGLPGLLANNDISSVIGTGSTALAGSDVMSGGSTVGSYDLAAVLGVDSATANATGADFLYDIVTALGHESGTAAATSGGNLLTDLLSLF
jgi:hypothetical protein